MTILFSIENGFSSRYLLRTGILERLRDAGIPIVVASPNAHEEYFREFLLARGVNVIPQPALAPASPRSLRARLELIRYYGLPTINDGSNIEVKYRSFVERRPMRPLFLKAFDFGIKTHRRKKWARRVLTTVGQAFDVNAYREILQRHHVALVLVDGIGLLGPHMSEWARAAHGLVRSMTVVTNWDHPTTKGYRSTLTSRYLVWSPTMEQELVTYHDVPLERIEQTGAAVFDIYAHNGALFNRAQVCAEFGLDPMRPIVVYVSNSPVDFPHNLAIANFLAETLRQLPNAPQLLVRLHPLFLRASAASELAQHRDLAKRSGVAYSIPHVLSQTLLPDMDADEIRISASLIAASDVVVNLFSTMQLDACICDKPVVNIGFDWAEGSRGSQRAACFQFYDHLRSLVSLNAVQIASTRNELVMLLQDSLASPRTQAAQRRAVVKQEAGIVDGNASDRIADAILREYQTVARREA